MSGRSRYGGDSSSRQHRRSASPRSRTSGQEDRRRRDRSSSRDRGSHRDRSRDVNPRDSKRSSPSRSRSRSRHGGSDRASVARKDREEEAQRDRNDASSRHPRGHRAERERSLGSRSTPSAASERRSSHQDRVATDQQPTSSELEPHPVHLEPHRQSSATNEHQTNAVDKPTSESSREELSRQPSSSTPQRSNRVRWSQPSPTSQKRADSTSDSLRPSPMPAADPVLEKKRAARRESWRAYLKSSSDFNRAEMKFIALDADLSVAEFWLEIMTKNLEDVGRRIEAHDWNYQKAKEQGELES